MFLTPERYNEHPHPFYMGVPPRYKYPQFFFPTKFSQALSNLKSAVVQLWSKTNFFQA